MSRHEPFDLEQLEHHLDVFGSDLERWPADVQPAARRLLESSPEARAALAKAEHLTALLDAVPDVLPSAALQARIAALPARHPRGAAGWWPFGNPIAPLLAWAAAAVLGVVVGSSSTPLLEAELADDARSALLSDAFEQEGAEAAGDEWTELELALGFYPEWEEEP